MNKRPMFSVVVPIYNVEKYLEECIESVLCQHNNMLELILVDDGSTDSCPKICDRYSQDYSFVKTIHKENGGLSSARNTGLENALGEYIMFVDSDDRIDRNCLKEISEKIKNTEADLYFMQARKFYKDNDFVDLGDDIHFSDLKGKELNQIYRYISGKSKYPGSACTKIYKRSFLNDNNFWFPSDRRYSEDLGFVRDCIFNAQTISAIDCYYYEYRQLREGSITNRYTYKNFEGVYRFLEDSTRIADKCENNDKKSAILSICAYEYLILMYIYSVLSKEEKREAIEILKKNKYLLKYGKSKKAKIARIVCLFFGLSLTTKIINKIKGR